MYQIVIESLSLLIAIFLGIICYSKMTLFHKLILFQLVTGLVIYLISYGITIFQEAKHLAKNNQWLYNAYMCAEMLLLSTAVNFQLVSKKLRRFVYFLVGIFFLVFCLQLNLNGMYVFANFACATESIILTILFLLVLYEQFQFIENGFLRSPFVLTSLAFIIYFGCNAPYFSFFSYLQKSYPNLSEFLFHVIIDVLSNIRHLLLAISFWLIIKEQNIKSQAYAK